MDRPGDPGSTAAATESTLCAVSTPVPPPPSPAELGFPPDPQPGAAPDLQPGAAPDLAPGPGSPPAAPLRSRGNVLAWWGFGLSFGSVLAAVAGAALALSVVGVVVARRTGRTLWPAVVGCAIAGLALGVHATIGAVHGVEQVVALAQGVTGSGGSDGSGGSNDEPSFTGAEDDYLTAISDSQSDTYDVYTDPALVDFGHQACDAVDGGKDADQAAEALDMGRSAAAEVVEVATTVLCPADAGPGPSGS